MKTLLIIITITGLVSCTPGITYGVSYTFEGSDGNPRTIEIQRTSNK